MRFGINVRPAGWPNSGVARVVINIIEELAQIGSSDEYVLFSNSPNSVGDRLRRVLDSRANFSLVVLPSHQALYEFVLLPHAVPKHGLNAFLATIPETSLPASAKFVLMMYDLMPELKLSWVPRRLRLVRALGMVREAVRRSYAVLCSSYSTRTQLLSFYEMAPDRVKVAHLGVDPAIVPLSKDPAKACLESRLGIVGSFFFMVNPVRFGRFFEAYLRYCRLVPTPRQLLVLGRPPNYLRLRSWLRVNGIDELVQWLDRVSDSELSALYSACEGFLYPSLHEGFGLPVLEAMHCGSLCVVYGTSSMPEIVGDAGLVLQPDDSDGMAQILVRLTESPEGAFAPLADRARSRASTFTWQRAARVAHELLIEAALS